MVCSTKLKGEVDNHLPSFYFAPTIYSDEVKTDIFMEMHSEAFVKTVGNIATNTLEFTKLQNGVVNVRSKEHGQLPIHPQSNFTNHKDVAEFYYPAPEGSVFKDLLKFGKSKRITTLEEKLNFKLEKSEPVDSLILNALANTRATIEVAGVGLSDASASKIRLSLEQIEEVAADSKSKIDDAAKKLLLHELVHANSLAAFDKAKRGDINAQKAIQGVLDLWEEFKTKQQEEPFSIDGIDMRSLQMAPEEFLAVAMSDKALQDYMQLKTDNWLIRFLKSILRLITQAPPNSMDALVKDFKRIQAIAVEPQAVSTSSRKMGYGKGEDNYYDNENKRATEIMKNILERGDKVETQYEGEKELDYYIIDATKYMRLTTPTGLINKLVHKKAMDLESIIKHLIAREWKTNPATAILPVGDDGEKLTQEQFAEYIRTNVLRSQTRGRIIHMMIEEAVAKKAGLTLDPKAAARLASERLMYKNLEPVRAKQNFHWVANAVDSYLEASGLNLNKDDQIHGVKVATEVGVYSKLLGFASRIDLLTVRNFDGKFGIIDTKTGQNVLDNKFKQLFNDYAYQTHYIHNSARDKAKLEILFRAIALKLENPDMQFYMLKIGNFQNEEFAARRSYLDYVEVDDFMGMIVDMFKDKKFTDAAGLTQAGSTETLYAKMKKQSPKVFEPTEYFDNRLVRAELKDATTATKEEGLKSDLTELTDMVANQVLHGRKGYKDKIADKTKEVLMRYRDFQDDWEREYSDINVIKGWLGNFEDWDLPAARAYGRLYHTRLQAYEVEAAQFKAKLIRLSDTLLKEYKARNNKLGITNLENIKYYVGNGAGLYDFAYVVTHVDGRDITRLRNKKDDPSYFGATSPLTKAQQDYLIHVNSALNEAGAYLQEERFNVSLKRKGETTVYKKSAIDLWNDTQKFFDFPKKRKIDEGFFWKFPKTPEEMRTDNFHKGGAFRVLSRSLKSIPVNWTYHMEDTYDADKVNQAMIPIKGLGSAANDAAGNFTYDLTFSTLQGHNNYLRKKHMDDVAVVGAGLQHYLNSIETDDNTMSTYKDILDATTVKKVLGINKQVKFNSSPLHLTFRDHKGELHRTEISVDKLIKSGSKFVNTAIMPLRFLQPIGTFTQALLSLARDITANSVLRKFDKKMKGEYENYDLKAFYSSIGTVFKSGTSEILGTSDKDKAAVMVREFGYLPKSYTAFVERDRLRTTNYAALTQANMYFMQALTEDPITYLTLVTQMKSIMHKGKSLWDWYEVKDGKLEWTGGVRYMEKTPDGILEPVTGVSSKELTHMKFIYEKTQGGYSASALAPIEAYYWGQALMSLKRWLPRVMLNMFHDTRKSFSLGTYIPEEGDNGDVEYYVNPDTKEKIPVAAWRSQLSEGKLTTAWRILMTFPTLVGGKAWTGRPLSITQIANFKPHEKQNLIELSLAVITLIAMFIASAMIWDDDEDDVPEDEHSMERKWFKRYLIENLAQQYNPGYLADNAIRMGEIMALKRTYDFALYGSKFMHSVVTNDVTQEGNYRFRKQFIKHVPYVGPIATTFTSLSDSELLDSH